MGPNKTSLYTSTFGARTIEVKCEHCGCVYFYEMSRLETNAGRPRISLFRNAAFAYAAAQKAQNNMKRRLAHEAELVPCPKCHWINIDIVHGYRRSCYRGLQRLAIFGPLTGFLICMREAVGLSPNAPSAAVLKVAFLFIGPLLCLLAAVCGLVAVKVARSRIKPNRNFPLPPRLPVGTPSALILNEETQQLVPANPRPVSAADGNDWFDFRINRHYFPPICCECLQPPSADPADDYQLRINSALSLPVPHCAYCAARSLKRRRFVWSLTSAVLLAILPVLLWLVTQDVLIFSVVLVPCAVCVVVVGYYVGAKKASPVSLQQDYNNFTRGLVQIKFHNPEYQQMLIEQRLSGTNETEPNLNEAPA